MWSGVDKQKKFELGKWDKATCHYFMLECLFLSACLRFYARLENFSLVWWRHLYQSKASNIFSYTRLSRPLSSEVYLTHQIYSDNEIRLLCSSPRNLLPSVWQWSYPFLFLRLIYICRGSDSDTQTSTCEANTAVAICRYNKTDFKILDPRMDMYTYIVKS